MGEVLEQAGMRDVLPLPKARVPVVKFVVADTSTKVSPQSSFLLDTSCFDCCCVVNPQQAVAQQQCAAMAVSRLLSAGFRQSGHCS